MASRRNLKKLINQEVCLLIDDCYEKAMEKKVSDDTVEPIVTDAVNLFDKLIERVNTRSKDDKVSFYREIESDLYKGVEELTSRLAKV